MLVIIRRDCDRCVAFEYYNRVGGYISLAADLDSVVTDKKKASRLFFWAS